MADVFGPRQDAESENHRSTSSALSGFDVTRKALFFGYFLLGHQKKVARPSGRNAFDVALEDKVQELSPEGELLFFAGAKKSNQKKTPFS